MGLTSATGGKREVGHGEVSGAGAQSPFLEHIKGSLARWSPLG